MPELMALDGVEPDTAHTEEWWALEAECRPLGAEKPSRLVVATACPATSPDLTTWYLLTNLPVPGSSKAVQSEIEMAQTWPRW